MILTVAPSTSKSLKARESEKKYLCCIRLRHDLDGGAEYLDAFKGERKYNNIYAVSDGNLISTVAPSNSISLKARESKKKILMPHPTAT